MSVTNKTELVLTARGSLYHIDLLPGDVATTIILVGDPGRVDLFANYFEEIEFRNSNREINTITGMYKGKRLSVISTGMGTDNIEIVVNELDALFNVDLESKNEKPEKTILNLIRVGTSGALQKDIPVVNSFMVSEYSIGIDGLAYFYKDSKASIENNLTQNFINELNWNIEYPKPYGVKGSEYLLRKIGYDWAKGITLTAPGFYAPQGRELRLEVQDKTIIDRASKFTYKDCRVTNFEMETSALYILANMLGHNALTVCNIIANRVTNQFDPDYKKSMKSLIEHILNRLSVL